MNNMFFKKKDKQPEYVTCPVCGEKVKFVRHNIGDYKDRYLDGERKISLEEYLNLYMLCEHCGYIFNDFTITEKDPRINSIVYSKEYQDIFHSTSLTDFEKRVEFAKLLYNFNGANLFWDINIFLSDYYAHQNDRKQELVYLEKAINDVIGGRITVGGVIYPKYMSCFEEMNYPDGYGCFSLYDRDILADLYRRHGNFKKALNEVQKTKNKIVISLPETNPLMTYLKYQETLIINGITDRI